MKKILFLSLALFFAIFTFTAAGEWTVIYDGKGNMVEADLPGETAYTIAVELIDTGGQRPAVPYAGQQWVYFLILSPAPPAGTPIRVTKALPIDVPADSIKLYWSPKVGMNYIEHVFRETPGGRAIEFDIVTDDQRNRFCIMLPASANKPLLASVVLGSGLILTGSMITSITIFRRNKKNDEISE
ncbi:MAG: hypothetical protein FWE80_09735 [Oscillospiraceae bacterium]|nr:hypothetical protein [Oscillospiraceae bacterium]